MLKKLSFILSALITSIAHSGSMGMNTGFDDYTGFYLGADIGIADLIDSQSTMYPPLSHQLSATGIVGGGLVGYDYTVYDRFKIGLEGFMNANGLNISSTSIQNNVAYHVSASYNAGVRILPGVELYPNIIGHALLGYANAKFTIKDTGDYGYIDQMFNKSGFQCGLGVKTMLTNALALRADALYTYYGSITAVGGSNSPVYLYQTYTNQFSTIEGDLTLVYKFV